MAMIIKTGTVVANDNGNLKVMVERNEACGSCAAKGSCGQRQEAIIDIFSTEDFTKGDKIILESDSRDVTKYSAYLYVFPVVMMILGAMLPNLIFKNTAYDINIITLISVVLFLTISFIVVKGIDNKMKDKSIMKVRKI